MRSARVVVIAGDRLSGLALVRVLEATLSSTEIALVIRSVGELSQPDDLASLVAEQCSPPTPSTDPISSRQADAYFEAAFRLYVAKYSFSERQEWILTLYLNGTNDKEIATLCRCSQATIYEHWRRMARKVGGLHKRDVIDDFHRFLGGQQRPHRVT